MAFKKGHKKIGGREAGTPNKTPKKVKDKFLEEVCDYVDSGLFHQDMTTITDPVKRVELVIKMSNYFLPKQSSIDSTVNVASESHQSILDRLNELAQENEE